MEKAITFLAVALCSGVLVSEARAQHSAPLAVVNQGPFVASRALPAQRQVSIPEGWSALVTSSLASHFVLESTDSESLRFDGETWTNTLELRYGLNDAWDIALRLPYVRHSGGFLDSPINNWHKALGLSDGGRSRSVDDQLGFTYLSGQNAIVFEDDEAGLADVSLAVNYAFYREAELQLGAFAEYHADTGSASALRGQGAAQATLGVRFSGAHLSGLPITWHGQVGATRTNADTLLGLPQKQTLWFYGLSADWALNAHWSVIAQYDGHSAPFDSALDPMGGQAGLLSGGVRYHFGGAWSIEAVVMEDIRVNTAPDVTFQAALRYQPR